MQLRVRGFAATTLLGWVMAAGAAGAGVPADGLAQEAVAQQKPKEKPAKDKSKKSFAVIAGTVFRDPGFAFPGVAILLEPAPEGKTSVKVKKMDAVTDSRGEFAFRVPAAAMRYNLTIQATGHTTEKRSVTIAGEERQEVFVTLQAAKEGAR